jgi:hypothetical protein
MAHFAIWNMVSQVILRLGNDKLCDEETKVSMMTFDVFLLVTATTVMFGCLPVHH